MANNNYIELIYTMIDGEASDIERQTLFSELQKNSDLQLEFQNAININNAGKTFAASSEVPLHLTKQLFGKSGLIYTGADILKNTANVGTGISKVTSQKSIWSNLGKFAFSKLAVGLLGIVIGGLLGVSIYNYFGKDLPNSTLDNVTLKETNVPPSLATNIETINEDKPEVQNSNNYKVIIKYVERKNEVISSDKTDVIPVSEEVVIENEPQKTNPETINPIQDLDFGFDNNYFSDNLNYTHNPNLLNLIKDIDLVPDFHLLTNELTSFHLEINSSLFWNLPKETVSPEEIAKLHNLNIFLYYVLNNYFSFGIGARQETFYVKYNTTDELSRAYIYEQQPNLTNYEVSFRYNPYKFNLFEPILQLNFGGGRYGYTYRYGFGSEIKLYDDLALTLLLEYATLNYQHKSNLSKATKVGINYGINYNF